jgi:hypothetical protein
MDDFVSSYGQSQTLANNMFYEQRFAILEERIKQLEKLVQYPNTAKQDMREAAAKAQANEHLYAPLRSDTAPLIRLAAFARRLLDPSDLGFAVDRKIRDLAREALGMPAAPSDGWASAPSDGWASAPSDGWASDDINK